MLSLLTLPLAFCLPAGQYPFVATSRGHVHILALDPVLWSISLPHRTQIIYPPDASLIVGGLDLVPGCRVFEAGTGSGSLTHFLAQAVHPTGVIHTFEFHAGRVERAREEFRSHCLSELIHVVHRDVIADGFPNIGEEDNPFGVDAVTLDLPQPWLVVPHLPFVFSIDKGGRFCSFSPCIEQVQRTCAALDRIGFMGIQTVECLQRAYNVSRAFLNVPNMETMIRMGFQPNEIQEALIQQRFNNITATYLLLAQYDPQVHGRLPSLRSTDEARGSKSDTRPRQAELVLNGGIQPVVTTVPLQHSSRPSNTLSASFQPQANVGTFAHNRRIPDGGVPTRSSISSARCRIDPPTQTTLKEAVALQQSTRSVSSVVKTSSSSGGTTSGVQSGRITVATAVPPSSRPCQLRRSATSIESKTSMPSSATITSAGAIATSAHTTTFGPCSSTTAPPSQAPPPDFSITSPSFNCQAPVITMRPSAITTAHLKLMNGPSIPACAIVPPVLAASPVPSSKPLNYEPSFAAPLAREDEEHRGASKNSPPVSCARRAPSRVDLSALTSNEATRSSSTSSSASDDLSNSDLYDREWGSESTDSGHSCASRSINRERRAKQSECSVASVAVTVVPSPDALQLNSASNRRSSDKATPSKISTCEPNFARLPSVRRKSNTPVSAATESANAYASPSNAVASRSTLAATSSPISRASTCEQRSVFNNTASIPNPSFTSALPCYRKETDFCASLETAKQNGGADLAQKEYQQQLQTKPRLLHGQPSAADIISESNPFRLVADVSRSSVVSPPTVPPHTSRLPQVPDPSTSGSGLNPVNFLNGTIRRPNIPPPSLVSMVGAHPPNRVSYAYHSLRFVCITNVTFILFC
ncbi:unnamed protein product [Dicrocoelium dendriticum]|nr:unnamed protein product [Dicrocoelium dendriticum]